MKLKINAAASWQRPGYVRCSGQDLTALEARRLAIKLLEEAETAERRWRGRRKWIGSAGHLVAVPS